MSFCTKKHMSHERSIFLKVKRPPSTQCIMKCNLNLITRKNSWNWSFLLSLIKLISRKNSWNWIFLLSIKLISRKNSWIWIFLLSLKLFLRKNSWNWIFLISSKLISRKILIIELFLNLISRKIVKLKYATSIFKVGSRKIWNEVVQHFLKLISHKNSKIL